jgi:uncharacterized integral membrane protein
MRIKTIIILAIGVLLTIVFTQNLEQVRFTVLFSTMYVSKITMLLIVGVTTFILGYLVGRPGRSKYNHIGYDEDEATNSKSNTLSDEDKDYIN